MENALQEAKPITIFVNDKPITFDTHTVTGAQIKQKAGYALTTDLYRKEGDNLILVGNEETIHIHQNEMFVDLPPTPVS